MSVANATPPSSVDLEPATPSRSSWLGSLVAWLLLGAVAVAFAVFVLAIYLPQRDEAATNRVALDDRASELEALEAELEEQRDAMRRLQTERDAAMTTAIELRETRERLEAELQNKASSLAAKSRALEAAKAKLEEALGDEIAAGEIAVKRRGSELVVDLEHKILFSSGAAELNDRGKNVLRSVSETIRETDRVFQVAGHTDSDPVSEQLQEQYPTNWELSTARATNVVRFLVEECEVPGEKLVAAGYGEFRPIRSNRSRRGKRRNRRIEIVMRSAGPGE